MKQIVILFQNKEQKRLMDYRRISTAALVDGSTESAVLM